MKITRSFTFFASSTVYITPPFNQMAEYLNVRGWEIISFKIHKRGGEEGRMFDSAEFICNKEIEDVTFINNYSIYNYQYNIRVFLDGAKVTFDLNMTNYITLNNMIRINKKGE